jgi:hypothetical protein
LIMWVQIVNSVSSEHCIAIILLKLILPWWSIKFYVICRLNDRVHRQKWSLQNQQICLWTLSFRRQMT